MVTREAVFAMAEDTLATLADPGDRSEAMRMEMREDLDVYRALLALDDAARAVCEVDIPGSGAEWCRFFAARKHLRARLLPREGQ